MGGQGSKRLPARASSGCPHTLGGPDGRLWFWCTRHPPGRLSPPRELLPRDLHGLGRGSQPTALTAHSRFSPSLLPRSPGGLGSVRSRVVAEHSQNSGHQNAPGSSPPPTSVGQLLQGGPQVLLGSRQPFMAVGVCCGNLLAPPEHSICEKGRQRRKGGSFSERRKGSRSPSHCA